MMRSVRRPRWTLFGSSLLILLVLGSADAVAQESWDAIYLGGAKIGHMHTFVESVTDRGKEYRRVRLDIEMRLKRREDVVTDGDMQEAILRNAPDAREGFFAVPKVVE